ncbi:MAG TPA: sigma-70 family RNA polymerase sigma factor [Caulobacteraceae bacterium]|nr:sigma-70 family RNA polymerase sigma factor [Caulobacteraceae bacterium]
MDPFQREIVDLLPRLRRLARVLARDYADADDLVQLCVERALERRNQWRAGSSLDSWMFRIMKNAWIDETRARTRTGRVMETGLETDQIADARAPDMETRLAASAAERALSELPEDQRLAVALVLIEGLSYREAAEALEVPMGTLTSRLVRGRMALQERLEKAEI